MDYIWKYKNDLVTFVVSGERNWVADGEEERKLDHQSFLKLLSVWIVKNAITNYTNKETNLPV